MYMKIAFDVKGTLVGPKGVIIRYILSQLKLKGHQITVWSNLYSYATEFVSDYGLEDVEANYKFSKSDVDNEQDKFFDVAFEDDRDQGYLASKLIIFVGDVPTDLESVKRLIDSIDKTLE